MKLTRQFDDFLANIVNLNPTRITLLEDSIEALKDVIKASAWGPKILEISAQGSWAHKTIIKPLPGHAFDADLLVYVEPVEGWEAKDYVNRLHRELIALGAYKDKTRLYSHCVTIEYAGERKIDIAPCVRGRTWPETHEVCNRITNEFELSNPGEYTDWLIQKNSYTGSNNLRKVTRLLKFMRDIKTTFTCPSFLLTTLIGYRVFASDRESPEFSDVPTALRTLIGRLDDWLQANPATPIVRNPVLYDEIQSSVWDDTKYGNFRSRIHQYREWVDDAYTETDKEESIGKWQRVFGEDFAAQEATATATKVSEAAVTKLGGSAIASGIRDLVDMVKRAGRAALPEGFDRLPHMRRPRWRTAASPLGLRVDAQLYTGENGEFLSAVSSLEPLQPGRWLKFTARNKTGLPLPDTYRVKWRVTNTDEAASRAGALRGDFYDSEKGQHSRWEGLSYRGVHLVEAFVIRKADEALLGKSAPFYVVIE